MTDVVYVLLTLAVFGLLALALCPGWTRASHRRTRRSRSPGWRPTGVPADEVTALVAQTTHGQDLGVRYDPWLFRGGFLLTGVATIAIIASRSSAGEALT